jgi:SAM-dependent methyltransferase
MIPEPSVSRPFDFGDLGIFPVTNDWGFSRGRPIDRHYIESFLTCHGADIKGHVVEVGGRDYTTQLGGSRVAMSEVWDVNAANPNATIVADLSEAPDVPSDTFDCVILTQVLELIQRAPEAIAEVHRLLKPGGVALITVPGISQISGSPAAAERWSWSFYPRTMHWLLCRAGFAPDHLEVRGWGNLKTTIAFLAQLAESDLSPGDYEVEDPRYPLIVTARAVKSAG